MGGRFGQSGVLQLEELTVLGSARRESRSIRAQGPASCSHSTPTRTAGHATDSDGTSDYFLASRIRLNGVSVARRNRVKPASPNTCFSRASPACAPSARPTS